MYYLAYGMNTNLKEMSYRCPSAENLGAVVLPGYKLAFKGCCDIVEDSKESMSCVLWKITDRCEQALDLLEGYPFYYNKKFVSVNVGGTDVDAMIYFMQPGHKLALPGKSYLEMVTEGYRSNFITTRQIVRALEEAEHAYYTWQ